LLKIMHPSRRPSRASPNMDLTMQSKGRSRSYFWAVLTLSTGLALSVFLDVQQRQHQLNAYRTDLRISADDGQAALKAQLHLSELLVRAVQSVFLSSDLVTGAEFAHLYENLQPREQFPSLRALTYARRVSGPEGEHFITELVAPALGNHALIGLDVTHQASNLVSLDQSRDTDRPSMSAPFALIQTPGPGTSPEGVVMRLPVYSAGAPPSTLAERRARMVGSIAVSFRIDDLIRTALPRELSDQFVVTISDITHGTPIVLFRSHLGADAGAEMGSEERFQRDLAFGGRVWRATMVARQPAFKKGWGHVVLLAGVPISLLLSLLAWSVLNTQRRALDLGLRMSRRYRESEERFRALNEMMPALVLLANVEDGRITYLNHAGRRLLGDPLAASQLPELFEDSQQCALLLTDTRGCSNAEAILCNGPDRRFWASVSISRLHLDGRDQLMMVASDISEQRQLNDLLSHQASHDELTGLCNRREFERCLARATAAVGTPASVKALLYIDLDQFKLINDTSGHLAGDQLLEQLAAVMAQHVTGDDVLARLGGDEFGILMTDVSDRHAAEQYAEKLRLSIDGYVFVWENHRFMISASIGGVMIDEAGLTLRSLFAHADTACYMAKEMGRNRVCFYSPHDDESARRRGEMEWANRLRRAAEEQRLVLVYQEIFPLQSVADVDVRIELLLRFRDEAGQLIPPGAFLPAAEHYGLMPMIDRWVIETALARFDELHPAGAGLQSAAINLSGASIEDVALADLIIELLQRYRIDPARVCFEITETVAVRHLSQVARFMSRLREVGCRVALDDFGAGMSSFTYLKNLPVDIIKIDGSFVRDILADPVSRLMVRSVTEIGHQLGLVVVAEWVTDDAIVQALTELEVDQAQGFGLHMPETVLFHRL
jgi:diguanylate cyclase (GGDEF)-like protein